MESAKSTRYTTLVWGLQRYVAKKITTKKHEIPRLAEKDTEEKRHFETHCLVSDHTI